MFEDLHGHGEIWLQEAELYVCVQVVRVLHHFREVRDSIQRLPLAA